MHWCQSVLVRFVKLFIVSISQLAVVVVFCVAHSSSECNDSGAKHRCHWWLVNIQHWAEAASSGWEHCWTSPGSFVFLFTSGCVGGWLMIWFFINAVSQDLQKSGISNFVCEVHVEFQDSVRYRYICYVTLVQVSCELARFKWTN